MSFTIQRVGLLDWISITELTHAVTIDPLIVKVVLRSRCWSYRQRVATFRSVVSNVCMLTKPQSAKSFQDEKYNYEMPTIGSQHRLHN